PRLAFAARARPCVLRLRRRLAERVGRASALDPAGAVAGSAIEGPVDLAADDQLRAALLHRRRPDRSGVALLVARPDPLHLVELLVEAAAPLFEVQAARLEVVGAASDRQAEDEAPVRQPVDRRRLLGE